MTLSRDARRTVLALAVAVVPVIFVWHLELAVGMDEVANTTYDAGFWYFPPVKLYHALMWATLWTCWAGAYILARTGSD